MQSALLNKQLTRSDHGFTLVEISIVLAIIGLLVGGIMAGQSLTRSAQVRSVATDIGTYTTAFNQFMTEFSALPGDMVNATTYWGSANGNGTTAACYSASKTTEATCNGNGNSVIYVTNPATAALDSTEQFLAWQHLANAGLIGGRYTGVTNVAGGYGIVAGQNTPASKLPNGAWMLFTSNACADAGNVDYFVGCYKTALHFGGQNNNYHPGTGIITPAEAYSIDRKLDDGQPGNGNLRTWKSYTNCADSATAYNLDYASDGCVLQWGIIPTTSG